MTQKLNWTTNDVANTEVANTDSHSYRIETIGNSHRVIYSAKGDYPVFQSSDFDSVAAAKQWAQNYHNKYGADNE